MSDALRAMQAASDADFGGPPGINDDEPATQEPEVQEPPVESRETEVQEPEDKRSPAEKLKPVQGEDGKFKKQEPQAKKPSKFEQARTDAQALADSRQQVKRLKEEVAQIRAEGNQMKAEAEAKAKEAKIAQDPIENLFAKGYKPEDADAQAEKLMAEGDIDGSVTARKLAGDMRARLQQKQQEQQAEAQRWQTPGTQEFANVWMQQEAELVRIENQYGDDDDRELIKQFADHNSEMGKRLINYLANDPVGKLCRQQTHGIYYAWAAVKNQYKIERLKAENTKLKKDAQRANGLVSLGGSAPASVSGSNGHKRFEDLSTAEMRQYLRSKIQNV